MSLNGLDEAKVKEAHEAAAAEPGGWFLLKYTSRDEVELLCRGNGGIVEVRDAIAAFEEKEPLFGFLRYRRRNVILKCIPDECSRLVQARATVHFNAICERFSPYDTTFSIAEAKELKDTKLSAACQLHAASGSTSSSTSSLRRRRLVEIAEEEEEEQRASKRVSTGGDERPRSILEPMQSPISPSSPIPVTLNADLAASPEESKFAGTSEPPQFMGVPRPSSPAASFDATRRMSSQSTRPELYGYAHSTYGKPKVKLGPRPSLDVSGRPHTAGNFRPVSQIPAGFKLFSKGPKRGKSGETSTNTLSSRSEPTTPDAHTVSFSTSIPEVPPIPQDAPLRPHTSSGRPTTSSGISIKSIMPALAHTAKQVITPEKARLMKAMRLREQKKKLSMAPPMPVPIILPPPEEKKRTLAEVPKAPEPMIEEMPEESEQNLTTEEAERDRRLSMSNADSGIVMDATSSSVNTDQASEVTHTDSHPASPIIASSEPDQSTKASSLSGSTDETVQPKDMQLDEDAADSVAYESPKMEERAAAEEAVNASQYSGQTMVEPTPSQRTDLGLDRAQPETKRLPVEPEANPIPKREMPASAVVLPISKFAKSRPAAIAVAPTVNDSASAVATTILDRPGPTFDDPPRSPTLRIPKSKFSTQDLRSAAAATENPADRPLSEQIAQIVEEKKRADDDFKAEEETKAEPEIPAKADIKDTINADNKESKAKDRTSLAISVASKTSDTETGSLHSRRSRNKSVLQPIRTDLPDKEVDNFSDDDDLMDELQSATVEEARPMALSAKSPITSVFPASLKPTQIQMQPPSGPSTPHGGRNISNPVRGQGIMPSSDANPGSGRSISSGAAFLHKLTQQSSNQNLTAKPGKIGSSISQRIKALEKFSGSPAGDAPQPKSVAASAAFFSVRKSTREPSRSPSVAERANSLTKQGSPPRDLSRDGSPVSVKTAKTPPRERANSVASRLTMFEGGNGGAPRGRPDSIQVTARIVRDPAQPFPKMPEVKKEATEYPPLDLKQSPLVVDLKSAPAPAQAPVAAPATMDLPKETIQERRASKEKRKSEQQEPEGDATFNNMKPRRRSSLSIVRDFIKERRRSLSSPSVDQLGVLAPATPSRSPSRPPSTHQNNSLVRRLSISSRRSSFSKETAIVVLSPSQYTDTSGGSGDGDDKTSTTGTAGGSDKKKSRAGRLMRRLSMSIGGRSKPATPGISPTVQEESAQEVAAYSDESRASTARQQQPPTVVAYMGDVNVQFPDNLLWKRRSMCVDSHGFLVLSAVAAGPGAGVALLGGSAARDGGRGAAGSAQGVKRYHLSEFRAPYTPEMEVQELPNSVCLDFVEGSGLQIACEDRAGQLSVLHTLRETHSTHGASFGH